MRRLRGPERSTEAHLRYPRLMHTTQFSDHPGTPCRQRATLTPSEQLPISLSPRSGPLGFVVLGPNHPNKSASLKSHRTTRPMIPCDWCYCPLGAPASTRERPGVGGRGIAERGSPPGLRNPALPVTPGPSGSPLRSCRSGLSRSGEGRGGAPLAAARSPLVRGQRGEAVAHGCHGSCGSAAERAWG